MNFKHWILTRHSITLVILTIVFTSKQTISMNQANFDLSIETNAKKKLTDSEREILISFGFTDQEIEQYKLNPEQFKPHELQDLKEYGLEEKRKSDHNKKSDENS